MFDGKVAWQEDTLYLPGLLGSKVARRLSGSLNEDAFGILSDNPSGSDRRLESQRYRVDLTYFEGRL